MVSDSLKTRLVLQIAGDDPFFDLDDTTKDEKERQLRKNIYLLEKRKPKSWKRKISSIQKRCIEISRRKSKSAQHH